MTRNVTVGGGPLPDTTDYGNLTLRTLGGDELFIGPTYTLSATYKIVPGTYAVEYVRGDCLPKTPCNQRAILKTVVVAPGNSTLDLDVPVATVTRNVTVGGVPLTDLADYGNLYLRTSAGDQLALGATSTPSSTFLVAPGTYDVYYEGTGCLPNAPCNARARLTTVTIAAGASTLNLDVPVATVTRNVRVNGLSITDTTDYGNLYLRTSAGDELAIGPTYTSSSTFKVVAGMYDLYYDGTSCLPVTPCNRRAKLQSLNLAPGVSSLDIDVPLRIITRHATIAGVQISDTTDYGNLYLRTAGLDELTLDATYNLSTIHRMVPGTFNVFYEAVACLPATPCNKRALLGCITF